MIRATRSVTSKYDFFISYEEMDYRIDQLHDIERGALEDSTRQAIECHKRCYSMFCRSARVQAFPVSYTSLGLYLVQYCRWFGHTARSIPTIISHLKRANRDYSREWLDHEGEQRLADLTTSLKKRDPTPSKQKLPITHQVMRDIESVANLRDHEEFQHIVMCRVARDALLRGAELVALRRGEVAWNVDRSQATIKVFYSKAHKRMDKSEDVIISDYGPSSGVAYLREYYRVMRLDNRAPASALWPSIDNNFAHWDKSIPKNRFIKMAPHPSDPCRISRHEIRGSLLSFWWSHRPVGLQPLSSSHPQDPWEVEVGCLSAVHP